MNANREYLEGLLNNALGYDYPFKAHYFSTIFFNYILIANKQEEFTKINSSFYYNRAIKLQREKILNSYYFDKNELKEIYPIIVKNLEQKIDDLLNNPPPTDGVFDPPIELVTTEFNGRTFTMDLIHERVQQVRDFIIYTNELKKEIDLEGGVFLIYSYWIVEK